MPKVKDRETYVTDPQVKVSPTGQNVAVQFQIVVQAPGGPQRSGKHTLLHMTPSVAMKVLKMLSMCQEKFGWEIPSGQEAPPQQDRH